MGQGRWTEEIKELRNQDVVSGNFQEFSQDRNSIIGEHDSDPGAIIIRKCTVKKGSTGNSKNEGL